MEEDRPVHQGRVLEVAVPVEIVGELRVQAFVVTHHALAQQPETREDGQHKNQRIEPQFAP